jgi:hypothetical protein
LAAVLTGSLRQFIRCNPAPAAFAKQINDFEKSLLIDMDMGMARFGI